MSDQKKFVSLKTKLTITISAIVAIFLLLSSIIYIKQEESSLKEEMDKRLALIKEAVKSKGLTLTKNVSLSCATAIAEYNFSFLQSIVDSIVNEDKDAIYGIIMDKSSKAFVHTDKSLVNKNLETANDKKALEFKEITSFEYSKADKDIMEIVAPISVDEEDWGTLRIGFSLESFKIEKSQTQKTLEARISLLWKISYGIMFAFIIGGIIVSLIISGKITTPIKQLSGIAEEIASGDLKVKVPELSNDEIGQLGLNFDRMRLSIAEKIKELQIINETGKEISALLIKEELLVAALKAVREQIKFSKAVVFLYEDDSKEKVLMPELIFDEEKFFSPAKNIAQSFFFDECGMFREALQFTETNEKSTLIESQSSEDSCRQIMAVPLIDKGELAGVIVTGDKTDDGKFELHDVEFVDTIANSVSITLSNIALMADTAEKARMDNELKTAQAVQSALFPKTDPDFRGYEVSGYFQPASETGGDWYGYINCPKDNSFFVVIGDVTGHGTPAALVTAAVRSTCTSIERLVVNGDQMFQHDLKPSWVLEQLNMAVIETGVDQFFMTCFVAKFSADGEISFANAGHNFPLYYKNNDPNPQKQKQLISRGNRLGFKKDVKFRNVSVKINEGDILVLYTDGLIECHNAEGDEYGKKRFHADNLTLVDKSVVREIREGIVDNAFKFFGTEPLKDDITLLVMKKTKAEPIFEEAEASENNEASANA